MTICMNYNAYGDSETDLFAHPAELYRRLHRFVDLHAFMADERAREPTRSGCLVQRAGVRGAGVCAAGINVLAHRQLPEFMRAFAQIYRQTRAR